MTTKPTTRDQESSPPPPIPAPDPAPLLLHTVLAAEHDAIGLSCDPKYGEGVKIDDKCAQAEAIKKLYTQFHEDGQQRTALCFSGGGIRSATFNLGILQRLALLKSGDLFQSEGGTYISKAGQESVLDKMHFLSTVSGGGYVGGWFSAWARRKGGLEAVRSLLAAPRNPTAPPNSPLAPEAPELTHLRRFSRYLSPTAGLLGADTWTIIATYMRNLFINWLVLLPALGAVVMLPRVALAVCELFGRHEHRLTDADFWRILVGAAVLGGFGFAYAGLHQPSAKAGTASIGRFAQGVRQLAGRAPWVGKLLEGLGKQPRGFMLLCLAPIVGSAVLLALYWAWHPHSNWYMLHSPRRLVTYVDFGVVLALLGWVGYMPVNPQRDMMAKLFASIVGGGVAGVAIYGTVMFLDWVLRVPFVGQIHAGNAVCTTLAVPLILLALSTGGSIYIALVSHPSIQTSSDEDREWWARFGAYVLIVIVGWIGAGVVALLLPAAVADAGPILKAIVVAAGGMTGLLSAVWGYSAKTAAKFSTQAAKESSPVKSFLLSLAAPAFIVLLFVLLSFTLTCAIHMLQDQVDSIGEQRLLIDYFDALNGTGLWRGAAVCAGLGVFAATISYFVNLNKFSMHGMYRDRLIRAYLGASNPARRDPPCPKGPPAGGGPPAPRGPEVPRPDPFTGFDPNDNMYMNELEPAALDPDELPNVSEFLVRLRAHAVPQSAVRRWAARAKSALRGRPDRQESGGPDMFAARLIELLRRDPASSEVVDQLAESTGEVPRWLRDDVLTAVNRIILTEELPGDEAEQAGGASAVAGPEPEGRRPDSLPMRNRRRLNRQFPGLVRPAPDAAPKASVAGGDRGLSRAQPFHIVNIALNLVDIKDPAWQDRKAQSFTVSPLHSGSWNLGYRPSVEYGGPRGISLGTAVTISGAAASPNMGYHSNPAVTFVLAFFNVRLGCWLGNPGAPGQGTYRQSGPSSGLLALLNEALGRTDAERSYVYLSDGGHFENLGLYEMVRRRCHQIIVCDAGCDPGCEFEDLGNAVRKVRADMGIDIEFGERLPIRARDPRLKKPFAYFAVGRVRYSRVDTAPAGQDIDGSILYIKPAFYGSEPVDVFNYAERNATFPHETTADQFFSESQFESYRALGQHVVDAIAEERRKARATVLGSLI